jgi:hypothetical protein
MGNLCGKESKESKDNFTGPGRTVGSVPARNPNAKVSVPAHVTGGSSKPVPKVGGLGRTLGAGGAGSGSQGDDARSAAAAAAEVRKPGGRGVKVIVALLCGQRIVDQAHKTSFLYHSRLAIAQRDPTVN